MPYEKLAEVIAIHAHGARRTREVAAVRFEQRAHVRALPLTDGALLRDAERIAEVGCMRRILRRRGLLVGELAPHARISEQHGPLDGGTQLADIPGPIVT